MGSRRMNALVRRDIADSAPFCNLFIGSSDADFIHRTAKREMKRNISNNSPL